MSDRLPPAHRYVSRFGFQGRRPAHVERSRVGGVVSVAGHVGTFWPFTSASPSGIKPLRATPNAVTAGDLHEYVDLLDPLIESLDRDIHDNVVTGTPAELEGQATVLEYEAKKIEVAEPAYAAELRDRAAAKRALAKKTSTPKNVDDQKKFDDEWSVFYGRWVKEAATIRDISFLTTGGDWTQLQSYDVQYQSLRKAFEAFGYKASMRLPPAAPDGFPWTTALYIAGGVVIVGALAYVVSVARPFIPLPTSR